MKKMIFLCALFLSSHNLHAEEMNAQTAQLSKALLTNCAEQSLEMLDPQPILDSYVDNVCKAIQLSGNTPKALPFGINAMADTLELQVSHVDCIQHTVEGKYVNSPRSTMGIDLGVALEALEKYTEEKLGGDCDRAKMCLTTEEGHQARVACNFSNL